MTAETDAVIFTRRETWRKAINAVRDHAIGIQSMPERATIRHVVDAMIATAAADGVTLDRTSP